MRLTTATRIVVYLMGAAVLAVCGILLPELAREEAVGKVNPPPAYPFLIAAWVLSTPIFAALHQTLKILKYIDQNKAFSAKSVKALQNIKLYAVIFSFLIIAGGITVILVAKNADPSEDVTPVFTFGVIFTFVSIIIATFTAVLQKLLQNAIDMKSENDLIV